MVGDVVGSGVDFGDDDVIVVFEMLAKVVVDWHQFLAMSAPRCIEFQKDVLSMRKYISERLAHQFLHTQAPLMSHHQSHHSSLAQDRQHLWEALQISDAPPVHQP